MNGPDAHRQTAAANGDGYAYGYGYGYDSAWENKMEIYEVHLKTLWRSNESLKLKDKSSNSNENSNLTFALKRVFYNVLLKLNDETQIETQISRLVVSLESLLKIKRVSLKPKIETNGISIEQLWSSKWKRLQR